MCKMIAFNKRRVTMKKTISKTKALAFLLAVIQCALYSSVRMAKVTTDFISPAAKASSHLEGVVPSLNQHSVLYRGLNNYSSTLSSAKKLGGRLIEFNHALEVNPVNSKFIQPYKAHKAWNEESTGDFKLNHSRAMSADQPLIFERLPVSIRLDNGLENLEAKEKTTLKVDHKHVELATRFARAAKILKFHKKLQRWKLKQNHKTLHAAQEAINDYELWLELYKRYPLNKLVIQATERKQIALKLAIAKIKKDLISVKGKAAL